MVWSAPFTVTGLEYFGGEIIGKSTLLDYDPCSLQLTNDGKKEPKMFLHKREMSLNETSN